MTEERRRAPRIKKTLVVFYALPNESKGGGEKWNMTAVQNISELGMCLTINERLCQNDFLLLRIKLPQRPFEWQELKGRVLEIQELKNILEESVAGQFIARIEFLELKEEEKRLINEYVHWFLEKSGGA
jgi:hypothetical protein